mmetsp:Transcript_4000/g.9079  ORF Transcript_4000/g.9079 Transcript_4000/m.9079 type:complete len:292 (-) Transcript_4000:14-889(-)
MAFPRSPRSSCTLPHGAVLDKAPAAHARTRAYLGIALRVRRPQGEVVPQELHDERGVLVRVLGDIVKFGDGVLKGGARHLACLVRVGQHLVLEHGVVQGEAQADRVRHHQALLRCVVRLLVRLAGLLGRTRLLVSVRELRDVAVVVRLHLQVEDLRLVIGRFRDQATVKQAEDRVANLLQLRLHLPAVLLREARLLLVALALLLVLHARDDAPRRAPAPHGVLVGHRQQVALLHGQLVAGLPHQLHVVRHLVIALRLLRELGEVDVLLAAHGCKDGFALQRQGMTSSCSRP